MLNMVQSDWGCSCHVHWSPPCTLVWTRRRQYHSSMISGIFFRPQVYLVLGLSLRSAIMVDLRLALGLASGLTKGYYG